jgi:hypothetical protein
MRKASNKQQLLRKRKHFPQKNNSEKRKSLPNFAFCENRKRGLRFKFNPICKQRELILQINNSSYFASLYFATFRFQENMMGTP